MTDFTDIIKAQDRADEVLNANKAMINDGVESPNIPESAAQSVLLTEHPAQYEKTWEDMGRGEQIVQSLEFGYNNMKMAKAASEFMDANEASKIGLSAFADDIDGTDEESQKAVEALLAKDTAVNRQYKEEQADRAMASAYEYADLLRESTKFRAPSDLAKMQEAAKGKGFWEGLFDAGKVFFDGDVIGNSIYLAGTSFGAMAPYIVMATVGNKAAALAGMSAVGGAIAGAFMGVGSYQNEYGSYIADALKEKGYDLSDPESWRKALSDQATIDDLKYRAAACRTIIHIVTHLAVVYRTIYALIHISASLEHTDLVLCFIIERSRNLSAFRKKVLPFRLEINQCGDVRLPWFLLKVVECIVICDRLSEVFISKSGKAVAELMHEHTVCLFVISGTACIYIVHSTAAECLGIDHEEDRITWHIPHSVSDVLDIRSSKVTVSSERIISCTEGCILVNPCTT